MTVDSAEVNFGSVSMNLLANRDPAHRGQERTIIRLQPTHPKEIFPE
jgi:hypothetical protein